jgi:membrane protein DedA with SNARE-associated domain
MAEWIHVAAVVWVVGYSATAVLMVMEWKPPRFHPVMFWTFIVLIILATVLWPYYQWNYWYNITHKKEFDEAVERRLLKEELRGKDDL